MKKCRIVPKSAICVLISIDYLIDDVLLVACRIHLVFDFHIDLIFDMHIERMKLFFDSTEFRQHDRIRNIPCSVLIERR